MVQARLGKIPRLEFRNELLKKLVSDCSDTDPYVLKVDVTEEHLGLLVPSWMRELKKVV